MKRDSLHRLGEACQVHNQSLPGRKFFSLPIACFVLIGSLFLSHLSLAQEASIARRVDDVDNTSNSAGATGDARSVTLRHKFEAGEVIRWSIIHEATTDTRIQGNQQSSRMRSHSTRQWEVLEVTEAGSIKLVQTVEDVRMVSKLSDRPEVKWDSRTGEEPPVEYSSVPETIGVPLATFTFDPRGQEVDRESDLPPQDLGLGDIVIPLPEGQTTIGDVWDNPGELYARNKDNDIVRVATRQRYVLREVKDGMAYIGVETQVISPIRSPRVRAQIMQQMTSGTILFDIEAGRVWKQEFDWNEEVLGFDTPDSLMQYNARYLQEIEVEGDQSSVAPIPTSQYVASPHTTRNSLRIAGDKPQIRR